jgi:hypothetical protein
MGTLQNIILWETLQDIVSIGEAGECCEHISSGCMFFHTYVFIYIFLVQIEKNTIAREKGTTTSGEPTQNRGDSRNNAHLGPKLPSNHKIGTSNNKTFDTTN